MARLGSTIAKLMQQKRRAEFNGPAKPMAEKPDRLGQLTAFGSNPGALLARTHVPAGLARGAALVVVLHGCTQTAQDYAHGSGWADLADEQGFAVLLPEQQRANNMNLCFNWFSSTDTRRDAGEALSIRQMIDAMIASHDCDPDHIYITGLSAGGAMASTMLATYPELFKGGAIIAGLPHGSAASVGDAFARMRGEGHPSDVELAALVRRASDHDGPWPAISVWQGGADTVVDPSNAERIIAQWRAVHGIDGAAPAHDHVDGSRRRTWRNAAGEPVVQAWHIDAMGHGTPLSTRGAEGIGVSGPFMLDVGISSTRHIAASWGLGPVPAAVPLTRGAKPAAASAGPAFKMPIGAGQLPEHKPGGVSAIIEDALRAAGLRR
ncbi:extracellular catalytic domain type 1 short-chain-length polyhydroxyalkanoate depolymerase [Sandarakinorhabdus sp.]|uniref:extracellular catalytic domain type 1 short-chain-length polyhydroxyalkanoate depolymerase n=1 Tax=Sandarakinorhabdus sp. TaxID=1916663 RepID=UPI003F6F1989